MQRAYLSQYYGVSVYKMSRICIGASKGVQKPPLSDGRASVRDRYPTPINNVSQPPISVSVEDRCPRDTRGDVGGSNGNTKLEVWTTVQIEPRMSYGRFEGGGRLGSRRHAYTMCLNQFSLVLSYLGRFQREDAARVGDCLQVATAVVDCDLMIVCMYNR